MLITTRCRFLHIPKTGGRWVKHAMINSVKSGPVIDYFNYGDYHLNNSVCPYQYKHLPVFAVWRDPFDWYKSYWRFRTSEGWQYHQAHPFDIDCGDDDFESFIIKVIKHHPGFYSRLVHAMIPANCTLIDFTNLTENLIIYLNNVGEIFDHDAIRSTRPLNVTNKLMRTELSNDLKVSLLSHENKPTE